MEGFSMPIVLDQFNALYVGGRKGKQYTIYYRPNDVLKPWSVQCRGAGHYYTTLTELLAYMAGRGWIEESSIKHYQNEIGAALGRKWDEK